MKPQRMFAELDNDLFCRIDLGEGHRGVAGPARRITWGNADAVGEPCVPRRPSSQKAT